MKIKKLGIGGYGKFIDKEITFTDGLNLVFGRNEAGKSTLQAYIKAMLFDYPRKNIDGEGRLPDRTKYKPWYGSAYGGIMELSADDDSLLKIDRDFNRKDASVFDSGLRDITGEFPYSSNDGLRVGEKLLNMDRECFENTAFIKQGGTIVLHDDRKNLFEKLMNLSLTGDEDISVADAKDALAKAIKNLGNNRTKNRPFNFAIDEFRRLSAQKETADRLRREMTDNIEKQGHLENELKELKIKMNDFNNAAEIEVLRGEQADLQLIKGKYDNYTNELKSISNDIYSLRQQLEENLLPESITEEVILDKIQISVSGVEKQKLFSEINAEKELGKLKTYKKSKGLKLILCSSGIVLSAILALLTHPAVFSLTAVLIGLFIYLFMGKPGHTEEELTAQINIRSECERELALVNTFIEASGQKKASSFEEATDTLNTIFDMKKKSTSLDNQIKRKEDRKNDISKFRDDVTGNSGRIEIINERLDELKQKIAEKSNGKTASPDIDPRAQYESKKNELAGIRAVIRRYMQSDDETAALEESLNAVQERLDAIETEGQAMYLASSLIDEAAKGLQEEIIPELNDKTAVILEKITSGAHSSLHTGIDNEINTEFDNTVRSLWEFSDGTVDQMYFALRVAASDVFSKKETVPVIIDEAFAYYDEDRIKSTFELLSEIAKDRQVIIFTCKEKEIDLVSQFKDINIIRI